MRINNEICMNNDGFARFRNGVLLCPLRFRSVWGHSCRHLFGSCSIEGPINLASAQWRWIDSKEDGG
jgi:hypothetical protein